MDSGRITAWVCHEIIENMFEWKLDASNEQPGDEWNRVWASMQNRDIPNASSLSLPLDLNLGKALHATISEAPLQYVDYLYLSGEECPLCSVSTTQTDRLPASLNLEFDQIKGKIGMCAWVHRDCFEKLELSEEPAPIPW